VQVLGAGGAFVLPFKVVQQPARRKERVSRRQVLLPEVARQHKSAALLLRRGFQLFHDRWHKQLEYHSAVPL